MWQVFSFWIKPGKTIEILEQEETKTVNKKN
jgi:hypothetical protein